MPSTPPKPDRDALIKGELYYAETWLRRNASACFDDAFNHAELDIVKCVDRFIEGVYRSLRAAVHTSLVRAVIDAKPKVAKTPTPVDELWEVQSLPWDSDSNDDPAYDEQCDASVWRACDDAEDSLIVRRLMRAQSETEIAAALGVEVTEVRKRIQAMTVRLRAMQDVSIEDLRLQAHRRYMAKSYADIAKTTGLYGVTHSEQVRRKLDAADRLTDEARHSVMARAMPVVKTRCAS